MVRQAIKIDAPELRVDAAFFDEPFDWQDVFGAPGPVEVEIGIGKGRFLLAAAAAQPDVRYFGVEWANKYLRVAEVRAARRGLANVRFARIDAKDLVRTIPDASVRAYYVFYPDPWPKKRHQKRRFLREDSAVHLARTLVPDGRLHVATDHADYWECLQPVFDEHPAFRRLPEFGGEGFPLPADEPLTNFEIKYGEQGRQRYRASWKRK